MLPMFWVYILRDSAGRHYIGMTADLPARLAQHRAGCTQTTRRMQGELILVASRAVPTKSEALVCIKSGRGHHAAGDRWSR